MGFCSKRGKPQESSQGCWEEPVGADVQELPVRALSCKGQFFNNMRRNLLGKKSGKKGSGVTWRKEMRQKSFV